MSTTALVLEHLITGLQASIGMSMLIFTVFGWGWLDLALLADFTTILTFLGLAVVYPIGIFVDELADFVFNPWMNRIRKRYFERAGLDPNASKLTTMYLLQHTDNEFLKTYFNYIRMRIRVSRSTAFNLAFITFSAFLLTIVRFHDAPRYALILFLELIVGLLLTSLSIWVWYEVSNTFLRQSLRVFETNPNLFQDH